MLINRAVVYKPLSGLSISAGTWFFGCRRAAGYFKDLAMSRPYLETLNGVPMVRAAPGERHEAIGNRLYRAVLVSAALLKSTRVLEPRSEVRLSRETVVRPDLGLLVAATGRLWLAAEIVNPEDHASDTVIKKQIYEELKLPRLWMIDPRYDNVEVYHATQYGLVLQGILARGEVLTEKLLPIFQLTMNELFEVQDGQKPRLG